jgi:hypothetical protein
MKPLQSAFMAAARVRRALVEEGDIRAEIDFQNDINAILAGLDDGSSLPEGDQVAPVVALQLAAEAAAARRAGQRTSRQGPGSIRRPSPARDSGMPYVSLVTSLPRSA